MFRRSRFSVRPNVGTAGRTAATPQEAPSVKQEASEASKDVPVDTSTAGTDSKSVVAPSDKPTAPGDGNDQNVEGTSSTAAVQRRKRLSIKPKVAPGRPSTLARGSPVKSPIKAVSGSVVEPTTFTHTATTATPKGLQSPRRRRSSEDNTQPKVQPTPPLHSDTSAVPSADDSLQRTNLSGDGGKTSESTSAGQVKVPPRPPDKVTPSLPDKEAMELSKKAQTLLSSTRQPSLPPPKFSLSRLLSDPSDLQRLEKARKLRELLKQEMHKEKKLKKKKVRVKEKEYTLDPAKMTMRELIRYLPMSNPMSSSLEEPAQENETVIPSTPRREESPERNQEPAALLKIGSPREEEAEEEEAAEDEDEEDAVMVPQVRVAEDGSLIIDEESLTVEVLRAKGPNPAHNRDPIFERGSSTTYSSFRKGTYSKPWFTEETDMFFLAINMVGTDFSMICQLFPHRARSEIKNKFKKEERVNSWRVDKAFRERRKLDLEYFSKLLEKILEVHRNRKKLKSLSAKNSPKKGKRQTKSKKTARKFDKVEEEDENKLPDLEEEEEEEEEEEGEKENEELYNEGGTPVSKTKRKNREEATTEESKTKRKKRASDKSNEQDEACIPEDSEAAPPDGRTSPDMSESTEAAAQPTSIKPAKLSRGRAPKPIVPLGRKWGKKAAPPSTQDQDGASEKGDENVGDGASEEQLNKEESPSRQADERKTNSDNVSSEEEEDYSVPASRPTRSGRVPKPTRHLKYPANDDAHSSAAEPTQASPAQPAAKPEPKSTAKRGRSTKAPAAREAKKPKLVTLRASQSEYSDEEDEKQREEEDNMEQWPSCSSSSAPVFVPASLRSPRPRVSEVEETMEELDILANMPDVLGISQDALCPDASCERAESETAEPCEHQLDLLVDVIEYLSSEHTEVSEVESYKEAAQTLLTIGHMAHHSQSEQNQTTAEDQQTGSTSVGVNDTSEQVEDDVASKLFAQEENSVDASTSRASEGRTETLESVATLDPLNSTASKETLSQIGDTSSMKTSGQTCSGLRTVSGMDSSPQLESSPEKKTPQTRRGCSSEGKTTPNLGPAPRTAQSKSLPDTSLNTESVTVQDTGHPSAASLSQKVETEASILQEGSGSPAACAAPVEELPVEELPVSQKEEGKVFSPYQTRKSRFQKVKPNLPQTSRTVRPKPQTTKDPLEKDTSPSSNIESSHKTTPEVESQPISASSPEVPSPSTGSTSALIPSLDTGSTPLTPEELSSAEERKADVGPFDKVDLDAAASDQDEAVTESRVGRGDILDPSPVQIGTDSPAACTTPVEELPVSQKEGGKVLSTYQTRKSRFQKVKPNLPQSSRTVRSKPQTTKDPLEKDTSPSSNIESSSKTLLAIETQPTCTFSPEVPSASTGSTAALIPSLDPVAHMQLVEQSSHPTLEPESTDSTLAGAEEHQTTSAASVLIPPLESTSSHEPTEDFLPSGGNSSETNTTPRRRRFPKAKPNLGSSPRIQSKSQPKDVDEMSTQQHAGSSADVSSEQQTVFSESTQTKVKPTKRMLAVSSLEKESISADSPVTARSLIVENLSVPENTSSKNSTRDHASSRCKVEDGPASYLDMSTRAVQAGIHQTDDHILISNVQSLAESSAESAVPSTPPADVMRSTSCPEENTQQPWTERKTEDVQQSSEPKETHQTTIHKSQPPKCTDDTRSRPNESKLLTKASQPLRGRLHKPKPNLGRSGRPPQPVQNAPQGATASNTCSKGSDASVPELQPHIQAPAEGAIEQVVHQEFPQDDGPSLGFELQVPELSTQNGSTSSAGGTQSSQSLFPDMLSGFSDPDEPFFILSLTEIPVCPSGEVVAGASKPHPYLPGPDVPIQQQSGVPGERLAAGGDCSHPNVPAPVSTEETDLGTGGPDPAGTQSAASLTHQSSNLEDPVDPHALNVHLAETRMTPASKVLADEEAEPVPIQTNTSQHSELAGPSRPEAFEPKEEKEVLAIGKAAWTGGKNLGDSSPVAQAKGAANLTSRKPKGFLSFLSETNSSGSSTSLRRGKAASKGPKVKTPQAARKRPPPAPEASTSLDVASETQLTLSSSSPETKTEEDAAQTEVPPLQGGSSSLEEDPTSLEEDPTSLEEDPTSLEEDPTCVSQYFLCDIFTEVDEE